MDKIGITLFILVMSMLGVMIYTVKLLEDDNEVLRKFINESNTVHESYQMYNISSDHQLQGLYFEGDGYCIWTKDRTESQIASSENHEVCHNLIYLDSNNEEKHFCNNES